MPVIKYNLYILFLVIVIFCNQISLTIDNRYFGQVSTFQSRSDVSKIKVSIEPFFIVGGKAFSHELKAKKDDEIVAYPEVWGGIDLVQLSDACDLQSGTALGLISPEFANISDIKMKVDAKLKGKGIRAHVYAPLTSYFGVGFYTAFMSLDARAELIRHDDIISQLKLQNDVTLDAFNQTVWNIKNATNIRSNVMQEKGMLDITFYGSLFSVQKRTWRCKKVSKIVDFGIIIPTAEKRDLYNFASIPFSENDLTGFFFSPRIEFVLKDDLKIGFFARLDKRFSSRIVSRLPILKESLLMAPVIGTVMIDPGVTFSCAPYCFFGKLNGGFGLYLQYTIIRHARDHYTEAHSSMYASSYDFSEVLQKSTWRGEYGTIGIVYDFDNESKGRSFKPTFSARWDFPNDMFRAFGFCKTHRVSVDFTVQF